MLSFVRLTSLAPDGGTESILVLLVLCMQCGYHVSLHLFFVFLTWETQQLTLQSQVFLQFAYTSHTFYQ